MIIQTSTILTPKWIFNFQLAFILCNFPWLPLDPTRSTVWWWQWIMVTLLIRNLQRSPILAGSWQHNAIKGPPCIFRVFLPWPPFLLFKKAIRVLKSVVILSVYDKNDCFYLLIHMLLQPPFFLPCCISPWWIFLNLVLRSTLIWETTTVKEWTKLLVYSSYCCAISSQLRLAEKTTNRILFGDCSEASKYPSDPDCNSDGTSDLMGWLDTLSSYSSAIIHSQIDEQIILSHRFISHLTLEHLMVALFMSVFCCGWKIVLIEMVMSESNKRFWAFGCLLSYNDWCRRSRYLFYFYITTPLIIIQHLTGGWVDGDSCRLIRLSSFLVPVKICIFPSSMLTNRLPLRRSLRRTTTPGDFWSNF
jgi:hypothetical protein